MVLRSGIFAASCLIGAVSAKCYDPSPAFPVPRWLGDESALEPVFETIAEQLNELAKDVKYDNSSFSVQVTHPTSTLWSYYHSAKNHNATRPGVTHVDGDSQYRIASISKTFTVLALLRQHEAGKLSLDDTVDKYITELAGDRSGDLPWKDITLRILASQLSGIPRDVDSEFTRGPDDPWNYGLPPMKYTRDHLRTRKETLDAIKKGQPVFAPNQKSTYSNINFDLLGLVLEEVTGQNFSAHIKDTIFGQLNMSLSTLVKPSDEHAVLPLGPNHWDVDEGWQKPTGGIYSTANDMSKYLRYILTHYNTIATGINWLLPASWSEGIYNFYGMPYEIFRTDRILKNTNRPVTFATKSGGLPGYYSLISVLPEYNLGITVLTAGVYNLKLKVQEIVSTNLVRAVEDLVWREMDPIYSGQYVALDQHLNSSMSLSTSPTAGLRLDSFISNSTDVLSAVIPSFADYPQDGPWRAQLVPTLLYKNESTQQGEIWRLLVTYEQGDEHRPVWDDQCLADVDVANYAGLPINEVVFWHDVGIIELPAWRVKMRRVQDQRTDHKFVVQA